MSFLNPGAIGRLGSDWLTLVKDTIFNVKSQLADSWLWSFLKACGTAGISGFAEWPQRDAGRLPDLLCFCDKYVPGAGQEKFLFYLFSPVFLLLRVLRFGFLWARNIEHKLSIWLITWCFLSKLQGWQSYETCINFRVGLASSQKWGRFDKHLVRSSAVGAAGICRSWNNIFWKAKSHE